MKGSLDGSAYVGSMVLPDGRAVVVKGFKKDGAACWADLSMVGGSPRGQGQGQETRQAGATVQYPSQIQSRGQADQAQ
jgi:hypothetical protein